MKYFLIIKENKNFKIFKMRNNQLSIFNQQKIVKFANKISQMLICIYKKINNFRINNKSQIIPKRQNGTIYKIQ